MRTYVLRRVLTAIPVLAGISLVLFTVLALAPGDPFEELATNPNVPPEVRMNLRKQFGLDDPVMVRYVRWFGSMMQGDWGFSFVSRVDVDTLILQRLPTTLFVLGSAQLLALLVALPVGILSRAPARTRSSTRSPPRWPSSGSRSRRSSPASCSSCSSASTWTGCPSSTAPTSRRPGSAWIWENLKQGIMPIAVLGLFQGAQLTRFVRSSVLDVIQLDYIRTARSKGLAERITLVKHVVRNALIPVVTLLAIQVPADLHGRHRDRADLPRARDRLAADRVDPRERHAGHHGDHVRVLGAWS